jgi:cell wall-associated NlpC family hydrolase
MPNFIINVAVMNLYKEPTFRSEVVTQGLLGESCSILEQSDNWMKIKQWDGYEGWANNFYGIIQDEIYTTTHSFFGHSCEIVNSVGKGIRTMNFGSKVKAEQANENYSITLPDGHVGYLESNLYVDGLTPSRDSIVNVAQSFLGIPYCWGGKSTLGFDCSGFVQSVFKAHDISLPRDSHEQADHFVNDINLDEVTPGDLLFFAEQSKISHVAISLGDANLVNARGWVRDESLEPSSSVFSQKLKDLFVKVVSIDEVVKN